MPTEKLSLHRKLAQVMYEAERIPKNGTAPAAMGGYKFVEVGDAADFIRKALAEKVVTMMPTSIEVLGEVEHATTKGGTMTTYTIRMDWTITDGESGETFVVPSLGVGSDTGDKFASKATTNAMKYALLSGFLLSTGDDNERANLPDRQPRAPGLVGEREPDRPPLERIVGDGGLIGKIVTSGNQDFELRETPDGAALPFRLKDALNKAGQIVVAHDDLARALYPFKELILGERVTVWGHYTDERTVKSDGFEVNYKILHLSRIQTADWTLPAPEPIAPGQVAAFSDEEAAAILEAEEAEAAR